MITRNRWRCSGCAVYITARPTKSGERGWGCIYLDDLAFSSTSRWCFAIAATEERGTKLRSASRAKAAVFPQALFDDTCNRTRRRQKIWPTSRSLFPGHPNRRRLSNRTILRRSIPFGAIFSSAASTDFAQVRNGELLRFGHFGASFEQVGYDTENVLRSQSLRFVAFIITGRGDCALLSV